MLAPILKNQLGFFLLFCTSGCPYFPIGSAVRHCACNPLSQNTIAHITKVAMDDVICLGRRSRRVSFAFSSYFSRLLWANSTGIVLWMVASPQSINLLRCERPLAAKENNSLRGGYMDGKKSHVLCKSNSVRKIANDRLLNLKILVNALPSGIVWVDVPSPSVVSGVANYC